jgi:serine/threonine-protein kinase
MIQPQALIKGRYRVGRRLGDGGMAIVYHGHDLLLGRDVAIKTPQPQFAADPAFRARFEREARAAASLSHPNIIDVHDVGEDDGTPFIVMELVRGQSLKEIIAA